MTKSYGIKKFNGCIDATSFSHCLLTINYNYEKLYIFFIDEESSNLFQI
jgi:hypothetical protein